MLKLYPTDEKFYENLYYLRKMSLDRDQSHRPSICAVINGKAYQCRSIRRMMDGPGTIEITTTEWKTWRFMPKELERVSFWFEFKTDEEESR